LGQGKGVGWEIFGIGKIASTPLDRKVEDRDEVLATSDAVLICGGITKRVGIFIDNGPGLKLVTQHPLSRRKSEKQSFEHDGELLTDCPWMFSTNTTH
jgi:hypothetical protein